MRDLHYAATLCLTLIMGCSNPTVGCIEGTTQSCACSGGRSGVQTCTAEGRFAACDCESDADDAGRFDAGVRPDSGGVDGGSPDGGMMMGTGETVTETVGPEGGEIELSGATVTFPAGAVSTATAITITETTMPTPAGYRAFSPLYRFEPEGLVFASPLTVSIRSRAAGADIPLGTLFWSRPATDGGGWERLGGIPTGDRVTGQVEHFSYGFIADGVDYTEAPDRSCVRTRVLDSRTMAPSGVGLFFAMEDCWGRPITDLSTAEVAVFEDDAMLSSEASASLFEQRGLQVFVTLVIDMSSSTAPVLTQVLAAARELVQTLNEPTRGLRDRVQVGISVFAGERTLTTWQTHSLDLDAVLGRIDELATFAAGDPASTNLHGALVAALSSSASAQAAFEERNVGGAFAAGYVVLFTDGTDTSGLVDRATATAAVASSSDDVIAVGLRGLDYDPTALRSVAGDFGVIDSPDPATLSRDFARVAARIAGQVRRTYLLGYCSPKRSGSHTVAVGIRGSTRTAWGADPTFSATGFGPGCAPAMFDPTVVCGASECGGFGCGACDDRASVCANSVRGQFVVRDSCIPLCEVGITCAATATSSLGYPVFCPDLPSSTACDGTCVDLEFDNANCGACGNACGALEYCYHGDCLGQSVSRYASATFSPDGRYYAQIAWSTMGSVVQYGETGRLRHLTAPAITPTPQRLIAFDGDQLVFEDSGAPATPGEASAYRVSVRTGGRATLVCEAASCPWFYGAGLGTGSVQAVSRTDLLVGGRYSTEERNAIDIVTIDMSGTESPMATVNTAATRFSLSRANNGDLVLVELGSTSWTAPIDGGRVLIFDGETGAPRRTVTFPAELMGHLVDDAHLLDSSDSVLLQVRDAVDGPVASLARLELGHGVVRWRNGARAGVPVSGHNQRVVVSLAGGGLVVLDPRGNPRDFNFDRLGLGPYFPDRVLPYVPACSTDSDCSAGLRCCANPPGYPSYCGPECL